MSNSATILGCGSSGGVPRVGGDWGLCDPANAKNRRLRCSLLLEQQSAAGVTRVVIDTSPDMRAQMLAADVKTLDGAWYTHEHADHTHGIDELRGYFLMQRKRVPIWADTQTADMLRTRFAYCFMSLPGSDYPPVLGLNGIVAGTALNTKGAGGVLSGMPFEVQHGQIRALGFRIGNLAYTPDLDGVPDESIRHLEGLDTWIVDALRRAPHSSHFNLSQTLTWIERLKPKRAILTNMHVDLDYATLLGELPAYVVPAFDGMKISF